MTFDKVYTYLQKKVKILLIIIAALVITVVLLLIFRPKNSIPDSVYKHKIDSLNHEIYVLEEMKKIQNEAIKDKDNLIATIESRDSVLVLQYSQKYNQLKNIKSTYDKKRVDIDKYGSADIKRAFAELSFTDDD